MEKPAHLLYVEDDETLAFVTRDHLLLRGYEVTHFSDGQAALDAVIENDYDLCLLDVMLPKLDGFELARQIRKRDEAIPILFITAKSMKEDKLKGFELGGDDYINKPFSIEELIMKIEVFLKRRDISGGGGEKADEIALGGYRLIPGQLLLKYGDIEKQLTQRESDILSYFASRQNELITRSELLKDIWGTDDYFLGRSMDVFISKLRKYLSSDPQIRIQNVHGVGFKLVVP